MLKKKLKSLDGLSDEVKKLYKEVDGEFLLQIDGDSDTEIQALKKKNTELLDELKSGKRKKADEDDAAKKAAEDKAREAGDFKSMLTSAQEKIKALEDNRDDMIQKSNSQKIDQSVISLASKLCDGTNVDIMKQCLLPRLKVNAEGKVVVLDKSGGETVFSQDELVSSIQKDPTYASIIRGTQSKGGGATGGNTSGAGSDDTPKQNTLDKLIKYHEDNAKGASGD